MFQNQKTILLLGAENNYLLSSLESQLTSRGLGVAIVPFLSEEIDSKIGSVDGILIHVEEDTSSRKKTLEYLSEVTNERNIPIYLFGYPMDIDSVRFSLPDHLVRKEFERPVNIKELAEKLTETITEVSSTTKKKILVVDDSGASLRMIKGWLDDEYNIALANSGAMAIKYLALEKPDLVLLDYDMPICNGKMTLEMMRSVDKYKDVPVMFLTTKGDRDTVMEVIPLHPAGYLLKSMKPIQIIAAVREYFAKHADK